MTAVLIIAGLVSLLGGVMYLTNRSKNAGILQGEVSEREKRLNEEGLRWNKFMESLPDLLDDPNSILRIKRKGKEVMFNSPRTDVRVVKRD